MINTYKKGISMLEILVVIAILAIIFSIVIPQFSQNRNNQTLKNGGADILSALNKARAETLASLNSSEYGVHFESDKVIIFKGKVFSSGAISNETISIISPATISIITLTGSAVDIYFNRLSGSPSVTGSITIGNGSLTKIITISATGIASMN